ncbi:tryptophan 7-halogenase [Paraburkholderia sp. BL17N1]|uniref:NAD(P)/FAD-dependent oxidoreductase n=1 Tax=Paraburkholderia sp. BL17N1 TaxID=1938798 RepID=UPI000EB48AAB|nr:tryptophan 7-halogenase [Paraburkholderia sp. BL17N1]RKR43221.1 flavin-dependent dehydrogenase [Paraburkholderia sp. BL17N1]
MRCVADVIVVGAGPAGAAAAIQSALLGRSVVMLERGLARARPGETLHPGTEAILAQLGVLAQVEAVAEIRHTAIDVDWGGRLQRVPYAPAGQGPWFGYQVDRARLEAILLARAQALEVEILHPCRALAVDVNDAVVKVTSSDGVIGGRVLIDATGSAAWLSRQLGICIGRYSPPLRSRFGYCATRGSNGDAVPQLVGTRAGWSWVAPLGAARTAWVQTTWNGSKPRKPPSLDGAEDLAPSKGADVTWRRSTVVAGAGFFVCGDAAGLLDPCSSHGVLRALMSGMMAAYQASQNVGSRVGATRYQAWIDAWWHADVARLRRFYSELDPASALSPAVHAESARH